MEKISLPAPSEQPGTHMSGSRDTVSTTGLRRLCATDDKNINSRMRSSGEFCPLKTCRRRHIITTPPVQVGENVTHMTRSEPCPEPPPCADVLFTGGETNKFLLGAALSQDVRSHHSAPLCAWGNSGARGLSRCRKRE